MLFPDGTQITKRETRRWAGNLPELPSQLPVGTIVDHLSAGFLSILHAVPFTHLLAKKFGFAKYRANQQKRKHAGRQVQDTKVSTCVQLCVKDLQLRLTETSTRTSNRIAPMVLL